MAKADTGATAAPSGGAGLSAQQVKMRARRWSDEEHEARHGQAIRCGFAVRQSFAKEEKGKQSRVSSERDVRPQVRQR